MGIWQKFEAWGRKHSNPQAFNELTEKILRWLTPSAWLLLLVGIIWGLLFAPMDYQQKHSFRIIYIHVPSAALSISIYTMMAIASFFYFVWRWQLCAIFARSASTYGALMTALALITGAIWGKPTWGTYWTWDARLTSELILLFIYLAYILLQNSFDDRLVADRLSAILAIVGLINIPIIHYSVIWWNSLHQGATLFKVGMPSIAPSMLYPLLISIFAFYALFFSFVLKKMQSLILEHRIQRLLEHDNGL